MAHGPYSRLYHVMADEYPNVYDSPDLADYMRLLTAADQAWPTSARWQGLASKPAMSRLVECGLIIPEGTTRYRVKGLDAERAKRREQAKLAALVRHSGSNARSNAQSSADSNARSMPSREEKRIEENGAFSRMPSSSKTDLANLKAVLDEHGLIPPKEML